MYKIFGKHVINAIKNNPKRKGFSLQKDHILTKELFISSTLDEILTNYKKIILIDNATDIRNIGSIIRTAAILNYAVLLREKCRINTITIECAAGGTEYTSITIIKNLATTIKHIKKNGFWIVGLNENGRLNPPNFKKILLVVGAEGLGISQLLLTNCDCLWQLKSCGPFNIYNASISAAIGMYSIVDYNN